MRVGLFLAAAGGGFDFAGFVNHAGKFLDDIFFGKALGFFEVNKGDMGTAEEFFHIVRVAAGVFDVVFDTIFEFDGADGTKAFLIAKDKINTFVVNKFISSVTILYANFVTEQRTKADAGDDVKFLPKKIIEHLETLFFGANHQMFARAVFETIHRFALATTGGNAGESRYEKEQYKGNDCNGNIYLIRAKKILKFHDLPRHPKTEIGICYHYSTLYEKSQ